MKQAQWTLKKILDWARQVREVHQRWNEARTCERYPEAGEQTTTPSSSAAAAFSSLLPQSLS